jgi:hypothetical protein
VAPGSSFLLDEDPRRGQRRDRFLHQYSTGIRARDPRDRSGRHPGRKVRPRDRLLGRTALRRRGHREPAVAAVEVPGRLRRVEGRTACAGDADRTLAALSGSLAQGDAQAAAAIFAEDGVLEDLTLHTEVVGRQSVAAYLQRAVAALPYGQGASVRHVVGGAFGGGYEWTNPSGPVPRGVNAAELNSRAQIIRLSSMWDGSLVDPVWLAQRMALTIEH